MSNNYVISDLHMGHKNVSKFREGCGSSYEQYHLALEGLAKLRKKDTVYLLGDIAFTHEALSDISKTACRKVLILGNHCLDRGITMQDLVNTYDRVYSLHKYKSHWMQHSPIHPAELRGRRQLHGHSHYRLMLDEVKGAPDPNYINCCVEYTGYDPITFKYAISDEYLEECNYKHCIYKEEGLV